MTTSVPGVTGVSIGWPVLTTVVSGGGVGIGMGKICGSTVKTQTSIKFTEGIVKID